MGLHIKLGGKRNQIKRPKLSQNSVHTISALFYLDAWNGSFWKYILLSMYFTWTIYQALVESSTIYIQILIPSKLPPSNDVEAGCISVHEIQRSIKSILIGSYSVLKARTTTQKKENVECFYQTCFTLILSQTFLVGIAKYCRKHSAERSFLGVLHRVIHHICIRLSRDMLIFLKGLSLLVKKCFMMFLINIKNFEDFSWRWLK